MRTTDGGGDWALLRAGGCGRLVLVHHFSALIGSVGHSDHPDDTLAPLWKERAANTAYVL